MLDYQIRKILLAEGIWRTQTHLCIVKGQGFISPVDSGRQRAYTPSPSDSQL